MMSALRFVKWWLSTIAPRPCRKRADNGPADLDGDLPHASYALYGQASGRVAAVLRSLGTSLDGLPPREVLRLQRQFGPNEIASKRCCGWLRQFLGVHGGPLIRLLVVLCGLALLSGHVRAAAIIAAMVAVSALLRYIPESRSTTDVELLEPLVRNTASVTRGVIRRPEDGPRTWEAVKVLVGHGRREVPVRDLVPGDIVHLSVGDLVPADLRLVLAKRLLINQAVLTGESVPVEKSELPVQTTGTSTVQTRLTRGDLLRMRNLCFMGSSVVSGSATAVVLATGSRTYLGALAQTVTGRPRRPSSTAVSMRTQRISTGRGCKAPRT
jgi:Mg2+-importing ATPase